jgi:hypothetical protein
MPAPKVNTALTAKITVVCGGSGSGKSAWVKQQIKTAPRVVVWDIDDEYSGEIKSMERLTSLRDLIDKLGNRKKGKFCYVGKPDDFNVWCKAVFAWGNCVAVAEELAGVTSPAKAPEGWHTLVSRGRKRGIVIYGVTQRPSESDKTIMGNSTLKHVGMMPRAKDRKYMADEMDINVQLLNDLEALEYIEKSGKEVKKGRVTFRKTR